MPRPSQRHLRSASVRSPPQGGPPALLGEFHSRGLTPVSAKSSALTARKRDPRSVQWAFRLDEGLVATVSDETALAVGDLAHAIRAAVRGCSELSTEPDFVVLEGHRLVERKSCGVGRTSLESDPLAASRPAPSDCLVNQGTTYATPLGCFGDQQIADVGLEGT